MEPRNDMSMWMQEALKEIEGTLKKMEQKTPTIVSSKMRKIKFP